MHAVIQLDRINAAKIVRIGFPGGGNGNKVIADEIVDGMHDQYEVVQAFARHRIAEQERCAGIAEAWRDENRDAAQKASKDGNRQFAQELKGAMQECNAIAHEIRKQQ